MLPNVTDRQVIDTLTRIYPRIGRLLLGSNEPDRRSNRDRPWVVKDPPQAMREPRSDPKTTRWTPAEQARTAPYWFLALVGLIYASGYVIEMIHLATFGIRDAGGELWKARDIHIGVLAGCGKSRAKV